MKLNHVKKAWLALFAIVALFGICTYLVINDVAEFGIFVLPAFASYPLGHYVWVVFDYERRQTLRILDKSLPEAGFNIDSTAWNDEHTVMRYFGKFRGDNFMIEAAPDYGFINIYDMPWHQIKVGDPQTSQLMEAINDTNGSSSNMAIVVGDPSEAGERDIYTKCKTILPNYRSAEYLDGIMCEMLNQKHYLQENMKRPRPWLNAKKSGPIGFTVPSASDKKEE